MEAELKNHIMTLAPLTAGDFLDALQASLQLLTKKREKVEPLPHYVVDSPNNKKDVSAQALYHTLEIVAQQEDAKTEDLLKHLASAGLQEDRAKLILTQRDYLRELVSKRKKRDNPIEEIVDLQWKFGVVAGSSMEGEAGRTFVQVNFVSHLPDGTQKSRLVEMSLEKFYDFLHQLEKCKANLEYNNLL